MIVNNKHTEYFKWRMREIPRFKKSGQINSGHFFLFTDIYSNGNNKNIGDTI